jgi:hypothetical protein
MRSPALTFSIAVARSMQRFLEVSPEILIGNSATGYVRFAVTKIQNFTKNTIKELVARSSDRLFCSRPWASPAEPDLVSLYKLRGACPWRAQGLLPSGFWFLPLRSFQKAPLKDLAMLASPDFASQAGVISSTPFPNERPRHERPDQTIKPV